jgi:polyribonucleotide nucleotidyltransferase
MKVEESLFSTVYEMAKEDMKLAMLNDDKTVRDAKVAVVYDKVQEALAESHPDMKAKIGEALYKLQKKIVRTLILEEGKRVDGRGLMDIRPLSAEVGILPRTHGSGLFQRGQTRCSPRSPLAR